MPRSVLAKPAWLASTCMLEPVLSRRRTIAVRVKVVKLRSVCRGANTGNQQSIVSFEDVPIDVTRAESVDIPVTFRLVASAKFLVVDMLWNYATTEIVVLVWLAESNGFAVRHPVLSDSVHSTKPKSGSLNPLGV